MQVSNTAETTAALRVLASALLAQEADRRRKAFHLASVGQKVFLADDVAKRYGVKQGPFEITSVRGMGDDEFCELRGLQTLDGSPRFVRVTQLTAAPATHGRSPLEGTPTIKIREDQMAINTAADKFEAAVNARIAAGALPDDALRAQSMQSARDKDGGAEAYRLKGLGSVQVEAPNAPAFHLSATLESRVTNGVTFDQLCDEYAAEKGILLREAIHILGAVPRFRELADAR